MADSYLIEILLEARDNASSKIRALQREIDQLKTKAGSQGATEGLDRGLQDSAEAAGHAADEHRRLNQERETGQQTARRSQSDIKREAALTEEAARAVGAHADETEELRRQKDLHTVSSEKSQAAIKREAAAHATAADQVAEHTAAHGDLSEATAGSAKSLEELEAKARGAGAALEKAAQNESLAESQAQKLAERVEAATTAFAELGDEFEKGNGDLLQLRQGLSETGKELDRLAGRFPFMDAQRQTLRAWAEEARSMVTELNRMHPESRQPVINEMDSEIQKQREITAAAKETRSVVSELDSMRERSARERAASVDREIAASEREDAARLAAERRSADAQASEIARAMNTASQQAYRLARPDLSQTDEIRAERALADQIERLQRAGAPSPNQSIANLRQQALSDFGFASPEGRLGAIQQRAVRMNEQIDRAVTPNAVDRGDSLVARMKDLDQAARAGSMSSTALKASYGDVASGLRSVTRGLEIGSDDAMRFGRAMEDAAAKSKNLDLAKAAPGIQTFFAKIADATDSWGTKIVSLSAELRGLGLVAVIGLAQQLDSGIVALAGSFISVASGAAEAGAAIGGVFVSGLGQLIPMLSVAVAGLLRLRAIFAAVQASQQAQQEAAFSPFQGQITNLQNTNQLISAQTALTNSYFTLHSAQVQVRESQIALTQARIDAIRNITDLTLAEKQAQLELRGANLSLIQAQEAERAALATGDQQRIAQAQLDVQRAQLSQRQAQIGVPRSQQNLQLALRYGVSGSATVLGAEDAARAAQLAVVQAQQQIAAAQRQLKITRLTLAEPSSHETQQQGTLQYLLGQMSPVELGLFKQLNHLETELRSPHSPLKRITDAFIEPFSMIFTRLNHLLSDPKFLGPIQKLANAMGGGLNAIFKTMFGHGGTSFFEDMARLATQSIPVVTRSITGLMTLFENIARAAGPAFIQLSQAWASFWGTLDKNTSGSANQERLTKFFNRAAGWAEDFGKLAVGIGQLFAALAGDAAPSGMNLIQQFTQTINQATQWVSSHGPEVRQFFQQTTAAVSNIGSVIVAVARGMISLFSGPSLSAFAQLLTNVIIPALRDFVAVLGFIVTNFMKLVNIIPGAKYLLEGIVASVVGLMAIGKVVALFNGLLTTIKAIATAWEAFKIAYTAFKLGDYSTMFRAIKGGLTGDAAKLEEAITSGGTTAAERMGAAIREAGTAAAAALREALGIGGEKAAGEVEGAEIAGGARAGEEEAAGEVAGGASAAAEIGGAEVAGGVGAGASGAEGAAGGAAASRLLGSRLIPGAALGYLGYKGIKSIFDPQTSYDRPGGLAGLLGPTSAFTSGYSDPAGMHMSGNFGDLLAGANPFGGHFGTVKEVANQNSASGPLAELRKGLKNVQDASQLSAGQLEHYHQVVQNLLQQPDLTATQRAGLEKLSTALDPIANKVSKINQTWAATFQGISTSTGSVLQQVASTVQTNIQAISANLGNGTSEGAQALAATITAAYNTVLANTTATARGVGHGLQEINTMLNNALKAMNAPHLTAADMKILGPESTMQWLQYQANPTTVLQPGIGHRATGGWNPARPGGSPYVAGEAGYDEVTLTTDPRHAPRQQMLLGQYLQRAPHLARGGYAGRASIYQSPFGAAQVSWGRTDQGVDADLAPGTAIGAIGDARVTGVTPNWYRGQPFIWYQLLGGPDAGRYVYDAEQISGVSGIPATDPRATSSLQSLVGRTLQKGQRLAYYATSGTGLETGWATASGSTQASATTGYTEGQATPAGSSFRSFLSGLQRGVITGASAAMQLVAPRMTGVGGVWNEIGQGVLNQVTDAANAKLGSSGTPGMVSGAGITNSNWLNVARALATRHGWGPNELRAWEGVESIEDGSLSLTAKNPTSSAVGLAQFISGPGEYAQYGGSFGTLVGQLTAMANYIAQRYVTPSAALQHEHQHGFYAAGGFIGDHVRRMIVRHIRRKLVPLAEGGRAPWGGEPVPIIAHEGERVVNPPQWSELGRLTGMGEHGLDSHLGYDTQHPRQSFDTGGKPRPSRLTSQISGLDTLLGGVTGNLFTSDPGSASTALGVVAGIFAAVEKGFSEIGRLGGPHMSNRLNQLNNLLGQLADPSNQDSLLNLLSQAFQRFQTNLSNWIIGLSYRVSSIPPQNIGRHTPSGVHGSGFGGIRQAGAPLISDRGGQISYDTGAIGYTGQAAVDILTTRSLVEQGTFLGDEVQSLRHATEQTKRRIELLRHNRTLSSHTRKAAISKLESQYTNLLQSLETYTNTFDQNEQSIYQQEQQNVQDRLNQIGDVYQTQQSLLQARQSSLQTLGQYGALPSIDQAVATSAQHQIAALEPALREAQRINDPDLVAQIEQQIAQLKTTVTQATAQMIQDAMSMVQQQASIQGADVSMRQTIAQTAMQAAGSPAAIAAASALNAQALQLNQTNLQSQLSSYNSLLGQAVTSGNQGAVAQLTQQIDELTGQLAQNTQAIQDNTATMVSQAAQFIQARGQFSTGVYGGLASVVQTIGQTTGFTDVGTLRSLAQASNSSLTGTQQGLLGQLSTLGGGASNVASLLAGAQTPQQFVAALSGVNFGAVEAGQSSTWIATFESLVSNLESNTQAIAQNNQQLAQLNGMLLQPQQWSSTAWSAFREAIFTGMGNLLPGFQASLPAGAAPSIAPSFGSSALVPNGGAPTVGVLNVNHAPTSALDPQLIGAQLAYEVSSAL